MWTIGDNYYRMQIILDKSITIIQIFFNSSLQVRRFDGNVINLLFSPSLIIDDLM